MKNNGYTLIEVVFGMFFVILCSIFSYNSYEGLRNKIISTKMKKNIISFILNSNGEIQFELDKYRIKNNSNILYLEQKLEYKSSVSNNFTRNFNYYDNLDKGFSIYILDKKGKLLDKIIYSNNNPLKVNILRVSK